MTLNTLTAQNPFSEYKWLKLARLKCLELMFRLNTFIIMWLICLYPLGDGTGVNVYVIDTGVSPDHVDFNGRCVAAYDAVGNTVSSAK